MTGQTQVIRGRAADARHRRGLRFETLVRDRLPATLAGAVAASLQPIERIVDRGEVRACLREQRRDLRAFEPDGRAFGVVLVVGIRRVRRIHDRVELTRRARHIERMRARRSVDRRSSKVTSNHYPHLSGNVARASNILR